MKIIGACIREDLEKIKTLLDLGDDIEQRDHNHNTPLIWACIEGNYEIAKFLLERGADVNAKDSFDTTSLMFACGRGFFKIAKLLIKYGASLNVRDNMAGWTPLRRANFQKHNEIMLLLHKYARRLNHAEVQSLLQKKYRCLFKKELLI